VGGGLEEEIVQNFFVLKDQRIQFMGKGDNDMKVMGGEEPLFSVLEPFGLAQAQGLFGAGVTGPSEKMSGSW
jgi:hypothetical protein